MLLNSYISNIKYNDMKRLLLLLIASLAIFGCSKDPIIPSDDKTEIEDIYFVRYIGKSAPQVTYTNEKGETVRLTNPSVEDYVFERTIGPVYKGFTCKFTMSTGTGTKLPMRIEVKHNDEPFVVKVEGENSITYTIE